MSKLNKLSKNVKISLIIPVYNQEKFILRYFKRFEKLSHEEIELIFVDDGSTDNTKNIIKKLIEKKIIPKFFKLKANSGPGIARNLAIGKSLGDYLIFLDSDDEIIKKNLLKALKIISLKRIIILFLLIILKNNLNINLFKKIKYKVIVRLFLRTELDMCANFYLFNRNFLLRHKIFFLKGYYEDILFMLKVFFYTKILNF